MTRRADQWSALLNSFAILRLVVATTRGELLEGRSQVVACRHATSLVQNIGLTGGAVVTIELCTECPSFVLLAAIVQLLLETIVSNGLQI